MGIVLIAATKFVVFVPLQFTMTTQTVATRHHRRRLEGPSNPPDSHKPLDDVTSVPMIVLRDILGRELDTNSVQQRLINAARWRVANGRGVRHPDEWRLPHVPVPARPDYSRTVRTPRSRTT